MLGIERCFFEAVGESTEATWHYQPGIGSYRKINSYQHVGVGKGDFVKEDSMFGGEWVAVGKGSGSYVRIQTFQHVGLGHGDYDKEEITSYAEWKLRPCVIWLCLTLLLLMLVLLAMMYWPSIAAPQKWGGVIQRAVGLGPTEYFNCDVDFADWKAAWSTSKKDWCCQNAQRGCQGGFDCDAGFDSWKATWSVNKKEWCCSHRGRGCSKSAQLYDCDTGFEDWRRKWTQGQKLWCCTVYDKGCNAGRIEVKYDCKTTAAPTTWTLQKQTWCCKRSGIGCNLSQHRAEFDCQADIQNVHSWQREKRSFCCKKHDVGCAASYDCDAGADSWQQGWSQQKKDFCCTNQGKGCPPPKVKVDCSGSSDGWSEEKQSHCCRKSGKGCPTTNATTTMTGCLAQCHMAGQNFDCEARINYAARTTFANQENACGKAHSLVQQQCGSVCGTCSLGDLKCEALPVSKPFDCHAALQNWITSWSAKKKEWCCKHEMKGCGNSFCDNIEELHTWKTAKQAFCCRTRGNGCTGSRTPHLPPGPGYQWKHVKVDGLYTWVRHAIPVQAKHTSPAPHVAVHTTTTGFDCNDGYRDFVHGWSTSKKHWCCEHQGLACTGPNHPAVPLKLQHQWQKTKINGVWTWTQVRSHVTDLRLHSRAA